MNVLRFLTCTLFGVLLAAGCGGGQRAASTGPKVDQPYEPCYAGEVCETGWTCAPTTLPASSGYTGDYFCTSGCTYDTDCVQISGNYPPACIDNQCYQTCPAGNSACFPEQSCFTFDSNLGAIDLCTP